jgi:hypothetical protein
MSAFVGHKHMKTVPRITLAQRQARYRELFNVLNSIRKRNRTAFASIRFALNTFLSYYPKAHNKDFLRLWDPRMQQRGAENIDTPAPIRQAHHLVREARQTDLVVWKGVRFILRRLTASHIDRLTILQEAIRRTP